MYNPNIQRHHHHYNYEDADGLAETMADRSALPTNAHIVAARTKATGTWARSIRRDLQNTSQQSDSIWTGLTCTQTISVIAKDMPRRRSGDRDISGY